MESFLQTEVFFDELRRHWISALFVLFTVLTITVLASLRWYLRRRWQRLLEDRLDEEHELDFLPPLSAKDRDALALVKHLRRQVWEIPEVELRLTIESLSQQAIDVVRSIAAVYHEQAPVPEYEASLKESLQLVQRVTVRLNRLASMSPFRLLGEQKISDYQRYYQVYRKINENPLLQLLKRHRRIYRLARWAVDLKNLGNPLYWAGREISREGYFFMLRWFYLAFIGQVGREAMRLYSGRHFQREEERDAALICYRLFALTKQWGGPSPQDWSVLVSFIAIEISLESEIKLDILAKCSADKYPRNLDEQALQTKIGQKWYRKGLEKLLKQATDDNPHRAGVIQHELDKVTDTSTNLHFTIDKSRRPNEN